ncbi:MAG: monovalent cation/H(+) antiporter subunit G [Alphaproteobacteria bacterium]|nr:monovalent cation/H(+) antiporter subunit G [Alphaproteobacteria bacterium]MDP6814435.1 monovalent cation/H(+) antiporter subunit G [Alphaproteobacteria bacterium]
MSLALDAASWLLLLAGGAFVIIGAVGLIRMPDFFTRLHPAGLTDTMGAGLILLGLLLQAGWTIVAVKLAIIAVFLLFTSPTSSHATARAALAAGLRPLLTGEAGKEKDRAP